MFFLKKIFPTHSRGIWGLFGRTPKGFLIWTSFKGCTWPSKIWPTSSKKTKVAAVAEWQWRKVSLTFNIDIVSFRPHHLFAWWWGALPPGYLDLCTKCYQVTSRQGNSLGRGPLTPWPTLVSQQGSLFFLISIYPYLENTPNLRRYYKKLGPFYKKLRCDKFGN